MGDLLRDELGFRGVTITDALDMHAIAQGAGQVVDTAGRAAGRAWTCCWARPTGSPRTGWRRASARRRSAGCCPTPAPAAALARVAPAAPLAGAASRCRRWTSSAAPSTQALARRAAAASITLVRDDAGLLPLRPAAGERLLVVTPRTRDLTPADTSSTLAPDLAGALRAVRRRPRAARRDGRGDRGRRRSPTDDEIAGVVARARGA